MMVAEEWGAVDSEQSKMVGEGSTGKQVKWELGVWRLHRLEGFILQMRDICLI